METVMPCVQSVERQNRILDAQEKHLTYMLEKETEFNRAN